jgi:hypothetical protein
MKIDLNFNLVSLEGKEIEMPRKQNEQPQYQNAGQLVAQMISGLNKGNSIKLFDWAIKLWNKEALEVDEVDFDVLKALIEEDQNLTVLSKAQILKRFKK